MKYISKLFFILFFLLSYIPSYSYERRKFSETINKGNQNLILFMDLELETLQKISTIEIKPRQKINND